MSATASIPVPTTAESLGKLTMSELFAIIRPVAEEATPRTKKERISFILDNLELFASKAPEANGAAEKAAEIVAEAQKAIAAEKAKAAPKPRKASKKAAALQAEEADPLAPVAEPKPAPVPASKDGEMKCEACDKILPVTKFPTKAPDKDGIVAREPVCRACRSAIRAAKKSKAA